MPSDGAPRPDSAPRLPAQAAVEQFALGRAVVLVDRSADGVQPHVCIPADEARTEDIVFLTSAARGLISVAVSETRALDLGIRLQRTDRPDRATKRFGVSVEASTGVTTGISASDRALTARMLADPASEAGSFTRPGHVFPVVAADGGVLEHPGVPEAALDLARVAGRGPGAILCELLNEQGDVASARDVEEFAAKHALPVVDVADVVSFRLRCDRIVERVVETTLPRSEADFRVVAFRSLLDGAEHMALVRGDVTSSATDVIEYVHHDCAASVFGATTCDCHDRLSDAMERIAAAGSGVIVYLSGRHLPLGHVGQPVLTDADRAIVRQILRQVRSERMAESVV